jgi:hypothetical protein
MWRADDQLPLFANGQRYIGSRLFLQTLLGGKGKGMSVSWKVDSEKDGMSSERNRRSEDRADQQKRPRPGRENLSAYRTGSICRAFGPLPGGTLGGRGRGYDWTEGH